MIRLEHASRWYGQVIGINDISSEIPSGITALVGPNGAGKSTLMKLATGQLRPTTGTVTVRDLTPFANPAVYQFLGYCPEIENLYEESTGREFVTLLAELAGVPRSQRAERVAAVIERVGMTQNADRKIGGYSKGMRQRIKLAQSLVHDPDVLILDEPLSGLDPVGRRDISLLLRELGDQGKCVLLSSHILHEVEQITRNILLIYRGRLLAQGDVFHIRSLIDAHPHRIAIDCSTGRELARRLLDRPYVLSVRFLNDQSTQLEIETRLPDRFYAEFPEVVLEDGFQVTRFESPDNNLESVFKYLVDE